MNAFNPNIFAASFAGFMVDTSSIEVKGDEVNFFLNNEFDKEIFVAGIVTAKPKIGYFCYLPDGCISPEDEKEQEYSSLEVSNISICRVAESDGVEAVHNQPFILTGEQIDQINELVDEICKDRFERMIDAYEPELPDFLNDDLWERRTDVKPCPDFNLLQSHKG